MTLTEITQGLEKAVAAVDGKRAVLQKAEADLAKAQEAYQTGLTAVKDFHKAYTDFMSGILSNFGQLHK